MKYEKDPQAPEAEMRASRARLKRAREVVGKTPEDLGEYVGSSSNYYDIEHFDGDLYNAIGLGELSSLCLALGIIPRDLFDDRPKADSDISQAELLSKTREYIKQNNLSVAEFSDRVGFEIGPSLEDPAKVSEWNVDFLRWLCDEIGLDWRLALPGQ
jgi:transcriptional regulator with XRE-family HTH domain